MPKTEKKDSLHDLLIIKLQALYDVETQLVKALPKMAKKATDITLKEGFEAHAEQTAEHVARLEQAFTLLEEKPKKLKVEAIRGLIADAEWIMKNTQGKEAMDAALIAAAQYVEHYEMAGYGTAIAWANSMNHTEVVELLEETLNDEEMADEQLNELAESSINEKANDMVESKEEE